MVSAYILIETSPGIAGQVAEQLRKFAWVKRANSVTGPYDIICLVTAESLPEIGANVTSLQKIEGVTRTLTCLNVDKE
jgi:DNA-binding Lrp family transcriptional regulator